MNFVFFSVHFPDFNTEFSDRLSNLGVRVLGIGDTDYENLSDRLKASLTGYYKVNDLENYDEVLRAVGYFTSQYGKIDRFESLNEHWLETEAKIRTDFNISGVKSDFIENIRRKSRMKHFFKRSGATPISFLEKINYEKAKRFAGSFGYPIIIKPDKGSGSSMTSRISDDAQLKDAFANLPQGTDFIAEKFIAGDMLTYDGLIDKELNIAFDSCTQYGQSIMDVVNNDGHMHYISLPKVPDDIRKVGSKVVKAFGLGERFFHLELFRSKESGEIMALEINMRPPGAWMTDAINYSYDMDVYLEWARMVVQGTVEGPFRGKYYTAYASRKTNRNYLHSHERIMDQFNGRIVKHAPIEPVFSKGMGNHGYQFRSESLEEIEEILDFIQRETS
ncbi:MAG: ATP-grasp domain-containing protein [bacterium]